MDKVIENTSFGNHELKMIDRGILTLTGINKIDSFDNEEFLLELNMGHLHIKGEQLELVKLDTHDGNVKIKGKVNSIIYLENHKKEKEQSILTKLFK